MLLKCELELPCGNYCCNITDPKKFIKGYLELDKVTYRGPFQFQLFHDPEVKKINSLNSKKKKKKK